MRRYKNPSILPESMKQKPTRGGARKGAGRKPGSGKGRTVTTSSINLTPELWAKLDALRGDSTRSAWISAKINDARDEAVPCLQLLKPEDAPRDGTMILASIGWPWLVPAVWNPYDGEWVVCHMQAQDMANGLDDRWLEMEREKALSLTGWLPVPPLPGGYVFRPANVAGLAPMPGRDVENTLNNQTK